MNDLAELALRGLASTGRRVAARPLGALAVAGLVTGSVIVWAGGRVGAAPATYPLTSWFGLLPGRDVGTDPVPGAILFGAIGVLLLLWLTALRVLRRPRYRDRHVWSLAGWWGAPFVLGPPLLSANVYGYAARGLLAHNNLDPYLHGPIALDQVRAGMRIVGAVDLPSRSAPTSSGPLSLLVQDLAVTVTGGTSLGAVIALRVLAVGCAAVIGLLSAELAGPRRVPALAISVLNPAVGLFVVSGAHLDGLVAALLLGALVAQTHHRPVFALLLACAATGVQPVAAIGAAALVIMHVQTARAGRRWQTFGRDTVALVCALGLSSLAVPHGLRWIGNWSRMTRDHTPFAPANLVARLLSPVVPAASFDTLAAGGRIAAALAGVTVVGYLLGTARSRSLERTVGYGLLTAALTAPVLAPWHLIWGLACLAPTAWGARRAWVVALSCAACVLVPAGLPAQAGRVATATALIVIAVVLGATLVTGRRRRSRIDASGRAGQRTV